MTAAWKGGDSLTGSYGSQGGGEKIFEQAFLSGVTKTVFFPPYDPWFVGGYINYYYFGLYLISFLAKLSDLALRIVFTLATPTIFALTVVSVFSIVYSILSHQQNEIPQKPAEIETAKPKRKLK